MADRREFLRYAMVSAVPLATGVSLEAAACADGVTSAATCAVRHVVIDARHLESRHFGASLADAGAMVHALADGDATSLWQRTLAGAWRHAPVAVAGLTRAPALFILEQLAWSHGLRVVYHAEHVVSATAPAAHQVLRAPGGLTGASLARLGSLWPEHVADVVARYAPTTTASRPGPTGAGLLPALPAGAELLTSWIIAPV
jgi:hypothetical protein